MKFEIPIYTEMRFEISSQLIFNPELEFVYSLVILSYQFFVSPKLHNQNMRLYG